MNLSEQSGGVKVPAPAKPAEILPPELEYLKKIEGHLNFIRQVLTLAVVFSFLAFVTQICASMGLFPR